MMTLQHICKSFGEQLVLDDVSLAIRSGEVMALVGENGAGKTTLLRLLQSEIRPDSGTISLVNEAVGYVPQQPVLGKTLEQSFAACEPWQAQIALETAGLDNLPLDTPVANLSGGQKTRLALARVMTQEPTMLLLDEPTNNLDAAGLAWLEQIIRQFRGAVVLVSHDRVFMNAVATAIIELHGGQLRQYGGNYDFYRQQKAIERQSQQARYEAAREEKKRLEKAITTQREQSQHAHKHMKRSDNDKFQKHFFHNRVTNKYGQQAKALQERLDRFEDVERPETVRQYRVSLGGDGLHNKLVLRLENIGKSYHQPLLRGVNLELRGNQRVHVRGANGSGKTTLLQIVAGLRRPDEGAVTIGEHIRVGYLSQEVDGLNDQLSGFENLLATQAQPTDIYRQARSLGLREADLQKKPSELSRGQQAKLSFAKLLLGENQLLVLDEPTNHLDIPTRERIEAALQEYCGALLIASHDRYFLQQLCVNHVVTLV